MPSIDAPTHYERSGGIASSTTDAFFKWLDDLDFIETTGTVDSPLGFVGLINLDRETITRYVVQNATNPIWMSDRANFDAGWYIVRYDDNGLVWGLMYGEDCVFNEERARADFAEAERVHAAWSEADDNPS